MPTATATTDQIEQVVRQIKHEEEQRVRLGELELAAARTRQHMELLEANYILEGVEGKNAEERKARLALFLQGDEHYLRLQEQLIETENLLVLARAAVHHQGRIVDLNLALLARPQVL